jgi:hypothetical protein
MTRELLLEPSLIACIGGIFSAVILLNHSGAFECELEPEITYAK